MSVSRRPSGTAREAESREEPRLRSRSRSVAVQAPSWLVVPHSDIDITAELRAALTGPGERTTRRRSERRPCPRGPNRALGESLQNRAALFTPRAGGGVVFCRTGGKSHLKTGTGCIPWPINGAFYAGTFVLGHCSVFVPLLRLQPQLTGRAVWFLTSRFSPSSWWQ